MSNKICLLNTVKWWDLYDHLSVTIKTNPYEFDGSSKHSKDYFVWRKVSYSVQTLFIQKDVDWFDMNQNWLILQKGPNNGVNIKYHMFKDKMKQQIPIEKCCLLVDRLYKQVQGEVLEKLPSPRSHFFYTNTAKWSSLFDYLNNINSNITMDKPYQFDDLDSENRTGYNAWQTTAYSDDTLIIQEDTDWFSMNENWLLLQKGPDKSIKITYSMFKDSDGQPIPQEKCVTLLGFLYDSITARIEVALELEKIP